MFRGQVGKLGICAWLSQIQLTTMRLHQNPTFRRIPNRVSGVQNVGEIHHSRETLLLPKGTYNQGERGTGKKRGLIVSYQVGCSRVSYAN
jgi:hypothetical protein